MRNPRRDDTPGCGKGWRRVLFRSRAYAFRQTFDFLTYQPLDKRRQIVVKPLLEHGLEQFGNKVFQRASARCHRLTAALLADRAR